MIAINKSILSVDGLLSNAFIPGTGGLSDGAAGSAGNIRLPAGESSRGQRSFRSGCGEGIAGRGTDS